MHHLDGFAEYRGHTDLDKIVCPHCGKTRIKVDPDLELAEALPEMYCPECDKDFFLRLTQTPLGLAWQTWDKDPGQHGRENPIDAPTA